MFCYGDKEPSYKRLVPSGMLPAMKMDGRIITESDDILLALEREYGALGKPMEAVRSYRQLERQLFGVWCAWLCRANDNVRERAAFERVATAVDAVLAESSGPFFLGAEVSVVDCVFAPYVERMAASLYYYKGFALRGDTFPHLEKWFRGMETLPEYRGIVSDFKTHVWDLPPQMGACFADGRSEAAQRHQALVDEGPFDKVPDCSYPEPPDSRQEALYAVLRHFDVLVAVNPSSPAVCSEALLCALATLMQVSLPSSSSPPIGSDVALRYIRDRINVPRDMSLWAARRLKAALEATAALAGSASGPPISVRNRRDQDPVPFGKRDDIQ